MCYLCIPLFILCTYLIWGWPQFVSVFIEVGGGFCALRKDPCGGVTVDGFSSIGILKLPLFSLVSCCWCRVLKILASIFWLSTWFPPSLLSESTLLYTLIANLINLCSFQKFYLNQGFILCWIFLIALWTQNFLSLSDFPVTVLHSPINWSLHSTLRSTCWVIYYVLDPFLLGWILSNLGAKQLLEILFVFLLSSSQLLITPD